MNLIAVEQLCFLQWMCVTLSNYSYAATWVWYSISFAPPVTQVITEAISLCMRCLCNSKVIKSTQHGCNPCGTFSHLLQQPFLNNIELKSNSVGHIYILANGFMATSCVYQVIVVSIVGTHVCSLPMKHTKVVSQNARQAKPGVHLVDTTRVCFTVNEHTTKCSRFYHTC